MSSKTDNPIFSACISDCLFIVSCLLIAAGTVHAAFFSPANAAICLASGIFLFLLAKIDRFEEFAGLGLKYRLRKRLDEAEKIEENLRAMLLMLVDASMNHIIYANNEDPNDPEPMLTTYKKVGTLLVSAGVPVKQARNVLRPIRAVRINRAAHQHIEDLKHSLTFGFGAQPGKEDARRVLHMKIGELTPKFPANWTAFHFRQLKPLMVDAGVLTAGDGPIEKIVDEIEQMTQAFDNADIESDALSVSR